MRKRRKRKHTQRKGRGIVCRVVVLLALVAVIAYVGVGMRVPTWLRNLVPQVPSFHEPVVSLEWSELEAPNYYAVTGRANIARELDPGEIAYSPLDALGRAGTVVACVDAQLVQEGSLREREDMSHIEPSGWGHNERANIVLPDGGTYSGYFWNRSHLLAKSLGGQEIEQNLVCGTRMQNVGANKRGAEGGMAYPESLVRDWLEQNPDGYVYYTASPAYQGIELVCRAVVVDVRSSDGALDCEVVVYNAAKGYDIDYVTGRFRSRH